MRFPSLFFSWKSARTRTGCKDNSFRSRLSRFERLESRDLLSLSPSSADYRALVAANSFGDSEENAIWVTSVSDVVSQSDGKITLREALDYAGQSVKAGNVSTTIRFSVGGTFTLSATRQSLKISKSVTVDASDVGGITIKAQKTLALYVYGGVPSAHTSVSLTNVTITGGSVVPTSSSPAKGAAIQVAPYCNLTLNNCSVVGNTSTSALGVGIYMASGNLTLNNVVFDSNTSTGPDSKGGAVYLESGDVRGTNVVFSDNAAGEGGAVYVKNGTLSFANSLFDGNRASAGSGGAVSTSAALALSNVAFRDNTSADAGGALYVTGDAESTLDDVTFTRNSAINGGAVAQDGQSLTVNGASFINNKSIEDGGGAYIAINALFLASDATFIGNKAGRDGGAVFDSGSFYLTTGTLEENEAEENGGAIAASGYFEIRDANFQNNTASFHGGAIYLNGTQRSWLLRTTVAHSEALEGGGIYNEGSLTLAESKIVGNVSITSGGGVSNLGTLFLSSSEIRDNTATGLNAAGGGVLNYFRATLNAVETAFIGNKSNSGSGGAIANNGSASLDEVVVSNNVANFFGGGVFNSGELTSQYSTYSGNEATDGGAIADVYGSTSLFHCSTLWGNVASNNGGALYSYGTSVFESTRIEHNIASTAAVAAYYTPEEATIKPSFDSSTLIKRNVAASSITTLDPVDSIVVTDAETGKAIDGFLLFNGLPVNGASQTKTLEITNAGSSDLLFTGFSERDSAGTTILSYAFYDANGDEIVVSNDFTLGAGKAMTLQVTITPKILGSKIFEFNWTTKQLSASGAVVSGSSRSFSIQGSAEISKLASASTNVAPIDSNGFHISTNADGSFSIRLSKAPASDVIVYLGKSTDAATLSTDVLLFTKSNYRVAQTVTVSLDQSKLAEAGLPSQIVIDAQVLAADRNYSGTTFADITLDVADYILFQGDSYVDLDAHADSGVNRWGLNGDGVIDAVSDGSGYWVDSSSVQGDSITCRNTKNGRTTTTKFDVVRQATPPTAVADVTTLSSVPGFVRLELESDNAAVARWRVDWGDGSPYSVIDELSNAATFAHSYDTNGTFAISVELVDENGVGTGLWTTLPPQTITGVRSSSSVFDNASDLLTEDLLLDEDLAAISNSVLTDELFEEFE